MEMMRVMLDTSAYSALARGHEQVKEAIQAAAEIWLSPVVLGELHAGFRRPALTRAWVGRTTGDKYRGALREIPVAGSPGVEL
jgi:predicted nucleic acid-binding protein